MEVELVFAGRLAWSEAGFPKEDSCLPAVHNLSMDPAEHYDMAFTGRGASGAYQFSKSPGRWSGQDGGWTMASGKVMNHVVETFKKYPNIPTIPGTVRRVSGST